MAAEASAAADAARRRSGRSSEDMARHAPRSIRVLQLMADGCFTMLASELISDLTSGKHNGTSWLRPLALCKSANATLAEAAQRYDAALGWQEDFSAVTVFSLGAPNVFVPTALLRPAAEKETLTVRLLHDMHSDETASSEAGTEFMLLRDVVTQVTRQYPDALPPR